MKNWKKLVAAAAIVLVGVVSQNPTLIGVGVNSAIESTQE